MESLSDIVAMLRANARGERFDEFSFTSLADRIEAAAKREREASGNAAAMCKALCDIVMLTMKVGHSIHGDVACGIIASKAKHALSAPQRNCDVGTAEEQESRFHATGETYHTLTLRNAFAWAQMPYEADAEKEGGAK